MTEVVGWIVTPSHPISAIRNPRAESRQLLADRIVAWSPPGGLQRGQQGFGEIGLLVRAQKASDREAPAFRNQIKLFHAIFRVNLLIELNP